MSTDRLNPGLAVIHANRLESLRQLLVAWLGQHPLAPLENEVVLVQSNGMAQWLKLALAADDGLGICAAIEMQLPARFVWRCYQIVLGDDAVPELSPFDKLDIGWRIFRLLPGLLNQPGFAALRGFLRNDQDLRKRHQLSQALADLFDQYQVYRADWLQDWQRGDEQLRNAAGQPSALPAEQAWQARLWRAVVEDVPADQRTCSRASLHERFLQTLAQAETAPPGLPRRLIVFGISSLPQQTLQTLQALARFTQILLCVHNPCRYHWADIIEHRELLRASRRRQPDKLPASLSDEQLHLHANPLLAAWGKQGRDYIGLLGDIDDPQHYQDWFQRIDLFEDWLPEHATATLLQQLQQAVLELSPLPAPDQRPAIVADDSLRFHLAHSPQREVEILHDQLLAMFETQPLQARDVIVMVPDIDRYAPHIRAVFGRLDKDDPRYIPFTVSDQQHRGHNPLLIALEYLLQLPNARFSVSELLDLLDVPALRQRFAIAAEQLPLMRQWIQQAGIRWGLHAEHRSALGLPADLPQNTWRFGLRRMLLGYALGDGAAWHDIEPYPEIAGLDAEGLGPLCQLLEALERHAEQLAQPLPARTWGPRLRQLLQAFFVATSDADEQLLDRLQTALDDWDGLCERLELVEALPLTVVGEVLLEALDQASLSQPFLAGRVNFCTLMPMRAIPFQLICLLGMNDGEFPRAGLRYSFDLMQDSYRPGDRSRRDDDRYLFLEALLSARHALYISWLGRSVNDNTAKPPSLLVGQLRDYLAAGWQLADHRDTDIDGGQALLTTITTEHPLQAFSAEYFRSDPVPGLFSYAHEWRAAWDAPLGQAADATPLPPLALDAPLNLKALADFLRYPVKAFYNQRLKVWLEDGPPQQIDDEHFACDQLQAYQLGNELLQAAERADAQQAEQAFTAQAERQRRRGELPLAGFSQPCQQGYYQPAWSTWQMAQPWLTKWPHPLQQALAVELRFALPDGELQLEDWLGDLRQAPAGDLAQLIFVPQALLNKNGEIKYHNLLRPWLKHLAACAMGHRLTTLQIGSDVVVDLLPLEQSTATAYLQRIAAAWLQAMRQPLPVACKSAFAWLTADTEQRVAAAEKTYSGDGYHSDGELGQDAYLCRQYPDFEQLHRHDGEDFAYWAERLYQPLLQHCRLRPGAAVIEANTEQ